MERIPLTDKIREELNHHRKRTRIAPQRLLEEDCPPDLHYQAVWGWIQKNSQHRSVRKDHLEHVRRLWGALPDGIKMTPLTPKIVEELNYHKERTGKGATNVFKEMKASAPEGLSAGKIAAWLVAQHKTTNKEHLDYVLKFWRNVPDLPTADITGIKSAQKTSRSDGRVPLTKDIMKELLYHKERTVISGSRLLKGKRGELPDKLNASTIAMWFRGTGDAKKEHLDYVLELWRSVPDGHKMTPLKPEKRKALLDERERTGLSSLSVSRLSGFPSDVDPTLLDRWCRTAKTASKEKFDNVLAFYRSLPDAKKP